MAEEIPPSETEIRDALTNLDWFAVRLQGVIALAGRLRSMQSLLTAEGEKRRTLADLDQQIEAKRRQHRAELEAEATRITTAASVAGQAAAARITAEAKSTAAGILQDARETAAGIIESGRATAVSEAEQHAMETRQRQAELTRLGDEIAARRDERDSIHQTLSELRARIGASTN
jgi:chromosome segregation ATPase